jgi:hypothetical protein
MPATQRAGAAADMPLSARTGRICITLKLFASLTTFLPEAYRKSREMPVEVDANATMESIIAPLGTPPALVKLVLLNGVFVPAVAAVDALDPVPPAHPDAVFDHPLAQRLDADRQAVDLGQLLGRRVG